MQVVDPRLHAVADEMLLSLPGVRAGQMMGHPAYYVGRRLFACVMEDGLLVKPTPADLAATLARPDVKPFKTNPDAKSMSGWVVVSKADAVKFWDDVELFRRAADAVRGPAGKRASGGTAKPRRPARG